MNRFENVSIDHLIESDPLHDNGYIKVQNKLWSIKKMKKSVLTYVFLTDISNCCSMTVIIG